LDLVQEILLQRLTATEPSSLLCIAPAMPPAVVNWHGAAAGRTTRLDPGDALARLSELGRFDFAVLAGALECLSVEDGTTLIARLRDLHCHRFIVSYRAEAGHRDSGRWTEQDFRALTLSLYHRIEEDGVQAAVYGYDIDSYNHRRTWNSNENWAHPGNFTRYRW
jgi:hypothetical protein